MLRFVSYVKIATLGLINKFSGHVFRNYFQTLHPWERIGKFLLKVFLIINTVTYFIAGFDGIYLVAFSASLRVSVLKHLHHFIRKTQVIRLKLDIFSLNPFSVLQLIFIHMNLSVTVRLTVKSYQYILCHSPRL